MCASQRQLSGVKKKKKKDCIVGMLLGQSELSFGRKKKNEKNWLFTERSLLQDAATRLQMCLGKNSKRRGTFQCLRKVPLNTLMILMMLLNGDDEQLQQQ